MPALTHTSLCLAPSFEAPLADMLTERRRTVRKQYEAQQQRRALLETTNQHRGGGTLGGDMPTPHPSGYVLLVLPGPSPLHLDPRQQLQLQQQVQQVSAAASAAALAPVCPLTRLSVCLSVQHVQLLTQLHLLCRRLEALDHEATMTEHYLVRSPPAPPPSGSPSELLLSRT